MLTKKKKHIDLKIQPQGKKKVFFNLIIVFYVIYADLLIVALTSVAHAVIHITLKVIYIILLHII